MIEEVGFVTKELSELSKNVNWMNPDSDIEFYEQNKETLSDLETSEEEKIVDLINIHIFLVSSLLRKDRVSKAKLYISNIDILNQKIKHNQDLFNAYEETKEFQLGIIHGMLKNYGESASIYKRLMNIDPENDNYKDGYTTMREKLLYKQTNYLAFIGGVILVGDIVLETIFGYIMNRYFFMVGFLLVFIYLVFPYFYKLWIKSRIE